jgi:hypothetical protein
MSERGCRCLGRSRGCSQDSATPQGAPYHVLCVVFTTSQALKQVFSGHCTGAQIFRSEVDLGAQEDLARSQEAREEATEQLEEVTRQLHHLQHQLSASEAQGVMRERTHLQEETAQLRRELADTRSEAADAAAAVAAELRAAKKKHEIALQVSSE